MKSIITLLTAVCLLIGTQSCVVVKTEKKDNGKHKGWYKNRHNPHNPNTNNPGQQPKNGKKPKKK